MNKTSTKSVRLSINLPENEHQALHEYAGLQDRKVTEVVREWIRTLDTYQPKTKSKVPDKGSK